MNREYKCEKKVFKKQDIEYMQVHFDNGEYFEIVKKEIADLSIKLYDKLIVENEDICPVAESGFIKLKLLKKSVTIYSNVFVYDTKTYKSDRIGYIQNRIYDMGGIKCIKIFDENNWHFTIFGNFSASLNEEGLIINFLSKAIEERSDSDICHIMLNDINIKNINNIHLDFENCEGYTIYRDEILKINLNFKNELSWGSHDFCREVLNGYIKLKLDKEIGYRDFHFLNKVKNDKHLIKKLERRLCGKEIIGKHDICHLYVKYNAWHGFRKIECLEVNDIRNDEELYRLEKLEDDGEGYCDFVGGYCKRQSDGSILIQFGENAKSNLENQ